MSSKKKTIATREDGKLALVPKLRFPEFRNADGWKGKGLSDIAAIVMGSSPKSECYNQCQIGLPLLQGNADIKNRLSAPRIFTSEITKECTIGDILLSVRAPVGSVAMSIHHACIGRGIAAVRADRPNSQEFVYQWLLSYEPRWESVSQGGTFDAVNSDDLKGVALAVPEPPEQQKIADCLSSVDELMAAQARKVDALRTHKKGLMQQLFPREGETQPRLRFPEFKSAKAWQRQKISNLLNKVSDSVTVEPESEYREIGIRSHGKGVFHKDIVSGKQIGSKRVFSVVTDAFVVNVVFAWEQAVATTSIAEVGMIASHRFPMYVALVGRCNVNYMKYFFLTKTGKYLLGLASPGGAGRNRTLGQKEFEKLEIVLPQEVDEQMRIADCLSSIDTLITLETQKLEALKTHKKGLMQQLFPSPEERT